MSLIKDNSVNLTVTSPPYPMIEMWDELFSNFNKNIKTAITSGEGNEAFELMHKELDKVWTELFRVTDDGGFVAINIGDATRKIGDYFQLYSNHSRITSKFIDLGFDVIPLILWKKTTNSPNKFMGSGMLPSGAYVTLEHEYILLFRKGHKRKFIKSEEKEVRYNSAFFWEERNLWFSDTWDLKGVFQNLFNGKTRERSAAYPFELPYRLINMYSCKGDTILDPFLGTGTTTLASAICERNSIGFEIDKNFNEIIEEKISNLKYSSFNLVRSRIDNHISFIKSYIEKKGETKHHNNIYNFPVVTSQERKLTLSYIFDIELAKDSFTVIHKQYDKREELNMPSLKTKKGVQQISLFENCVK
jgi:DNA modification methylase